MECDKRLLIGMQDFANLTIQVIPTLTCVNGVIQRYEAQGTTRENGVQTVARPQGKFVMVNASESSEGSLTLKAKIVLIRLAKTARGRTRVFPLTLSNGQHPLRTIDDTYNEHEVQSTELGKPYELHPTDGKLTARKANAQRVKEWAKSECRSVMERIGTMYCSERRQTCPWSSIA